MQTGYDNSWMYQNNRHEQLLDLHKNDNNAYSVITDNREQMQNGRYPNNMTVSSMNNISSSCLNGQYRADTHCMWPSSVYSMPFRSSYANNYQSQSYPNHTNNFSYSSSKTDLRNTNAQISQTSTGNGANHVTTRLPQSSNIIDKDNARIRVRDVHTLNNTSFCDSMLYNRVAQTQNNNNFPFNYGANSSSRTCDFGVNLSGSKHLPSSRIEKEQASAVVGLKFQEQFLQYNKTYYQQNHQPLTENLMSKSSKQVQSTAFNPNCPFPCSQSVDNSKNPKETQNDPNNAKMIYKPKRVNYLNYLKTVGLENTSNINYQESAGVNKNLTYDNQNTSRYFDQNQSQNQNQNNHPNSQAPASSQMEDFRKRHLSEQSATSSGNSVHISDLENLVKITIPHMGVSTYITAVQPNNNDRNSSLSLKSLLESSTETYNTHRNVNSNTLNSHSQPQIDDQVRRKSCSTLPDRYQACNVPSQSNTTNEYNSSVANSNITYNSNAVSSPKNPGTSAQRLQQNFNDNLNRLEDQTSFPNSNNCLENVTENFSNSVLGGDRCINERIENSSEPQTISQNGNALNDFPIKQEFSKPEGESSSIQIDENITIDQPPEIIKTELYSEDYQLEQEAAPVENPGCSEKAISSNSNDVRDTEVVSEKSDYGSNNKSTQQKTTENRCSSGENEINGENIENRDPEMNEQSYKCKINRDKLDLLIQFLKKDDEVSEAEKNQKVTNDEKKKEEVSCSRRKLSKARIVKNKNNSREMVTMMSHKNARSEIQNSSKRTQIIKTDNEEKPEVICVDSVKTNDTVDSVSRKESFSPAKESDKHKKFDLKSEPEIKNIQIQENSIEDEKNIVNIMQALQNLKSHFCLGCTLVSPIDSFWINVASGELRCLNCFKKMNSKIDENAFKLNKAKSDDCKLAGFELVREEKFQKGIENTKLHAVCKRSSCVCTCEKSSDVIKREVMEPESESTEDSTSCTSSEDGSYTSKFKNVETKDSSTTSDASKKKSSEEQKKIKIEKSTNKSEDSAKSEIKTKRKLSLKDDPALDKSRKSEERALLVGSRKKSTEEKSVTTKVNSEKKNTSKEEIKSPKTNVSSDSLRKERKHSSESKEHGLKTQNSKDDLKCKARENSEKLGRKRVSTDGDDSEVSKNDKRHSTCSSQHKKKRDSKDEFGLHNVRISGERIVGSPEKSSSTETLDSIPEETLEKSPSESLNKSKTHNSTDQRTKVSTKHLKPKNTSPLEDSDEKHQSFHKNSEKERSSEVSRKRRRSVDECTPHKIRATEDRVEDVNYSRQSAEKLKKKNSSKALDSVVKEHSKHNSIDSSQKRSNGSFLSKEQTKHEMRNSSEFEKSRRNSISKENISFSEYSIKFTNYEENNETKKKQYLGKIPKLSHKSLEKGSFEATKSPLSDEKHQQSKPSESEKEIKNSNQIFKKKELYESKHKEHFYEKGTERKKNEKQKDFKSTEESIFEKKNHSEKGHKHDKNFCWSMKQSKKDRALECIFGRKKEELVLKDSPKDKPSSAKLMNKLIEKTKKLSWTLLGES